MPNFQVSMNDELAANWESLVSEVAEKLKGKKSDAMAYILPKVRMELAGELSPSIAPHVSRLTTYIDGFTTEVDSIAKLFASNEKMQEEKMTTKLKALNDSLLAKSEALDAAEKTIEELTSEKDAAVRKLAETCGILEEKEEQALTAEARCKLLEADNRDLQQSINALTAALARRTEEGELKGFSGSQPPKTFDGVQADQGVENTLK
ncbi:hypothetical protein ADLECEL_19320 [Adlercreutzia equolifaciens subsp. celatus]|uniref:Uncharacterized protein n=1 Tax=Adlercreutzia equolifaciens subsp. celatus DSM 18785 TaxID=1121021 RepID=A0A3N0AQB0_9ACTN|nr:hypothetical protein [Adlercreutzia equolifaciens]MCP2078463.1 hypothetical protein [Adlercreutzia equolifaciens subsp. celatus DSM 18785]RFT92688.1 hypothetical protein DX904_05690 [Adlercreutzia equolifaciens subsp. celatus]RNL37012.1 hypothetical protein DMP10_09600 [Adlercreutzia equolifaciens subsp. celatus DSM 18785]BCS58047.1 hypothetical protein ADLECEL_19320 [Adlercreutzia equolifaciens subsp. celatus]